MSYHGKYDAFCMHSPVDYTIDLLSIRVQWTRQCYLLVFLVLVQEDIEFTKMDRQYHLQFDQSAGAAVDSYLEYKRFVKMLALNRLLGIKV